MKEWLIKYRMQIFCVYTAYVFYTVGYSHMSREAEDMYLMNIPKEQALSVLNKIQESNEPQNDKIFIITSIIAFGLFLLREKKEK